MDVIGPIEPNASNGHRFILVAIDYFTKWVEAASYSSITSSVVAKFVKKDLVCRYGLPDKIITDNGSNLNSKTMKELCAEFKIDLSSVASVPSELCVGVQWADGKLFRRLACMVTCPVVS